MDIGIITRVEYPAVLVLSAIRRRNGSQAEIVSFADSKTLGDDAALNARLLMFASLEEQGAAPYTYTLSSLATAADIVAAQRRRLEFEAGLSPCPDL